MTELDLISRPLFCPVGAAKVGVDRFARLTRRKIGLSGKVNQIDSPIFEVGK